MLVSFGINTNPNMGEKQIRVGCIKVLCLANVVYNSKGLRKLLDCSEKHCLLVGDNFPTHPYPQANKTIYI